MRKFLMAALAAVLIIGATPALAQPEGTWEGAGHGWCPYPTLSTPGDTMYPWQEWRGCLKLNPDGIGYIFKGDWYDQNDNHGTFNGTAVLGTPTEIGCSGDWYWIDERIDPPITYHMGTFTMSFKRDGSYCHGTWVTTHMTSIYQGTMEGAWVEP